MASKALILGALAALALGWPAAAQVHSVISKTTVGFLEPAVQLWADATPAGLCLRPGAKNAFSPVGAARRTASREVRGELVAAFDGPPPIPESAIDRALGCASQAGKSIGTRRMLKEGSAGLSAFRTTFAVCMADADTRHPVGGMTLWIDSHCNW